MTWKDTLRKAPFNIGDAQVTRLDNIKANKKKLLTEFTMILEDFLDDALRQEIQNKPESNSYSVYVKEVADAIRNLKNNGLQNSDIIPLLKKEYNVQSVEIDTDGEIKFDGVVTL